MAKNQGRINFGIGFNVDKTGLESTFNSLKQQLTQLQGLSTKDILNTDGIKIAKGELEDIQRLAGKVQAILEQSFNAKLNTTDLTKFNQGLKDSKITIDQIQTEFSKTGAIGVNAFRNITAQLLTTNKYVKESSKLLDKMGETLSNTVRWTVASSALNSITGSIQKAYSFTKQLDTSLNDIMIVTEKSSDQMADFAKSANKAAKELGAVTTDYTKASLIYYQQGLSDAEVKARAATTTKVANITKQSAEAVSEQLTAVWNGYKVNSQEAELYIDKLSAVAASTAADLEELSVGMSRVASAANIMGVDIDQLNAQLATIVSITREAPESIGTALKTVYARMSDIEAGLDTETTLGEYTKQMAEMGINALDANGNLRDMGDVVEEIGNKWDTFNRNQQTALAQTIAGTRQYSRMMALFDNWDMYEKSLQTSKNSAGELQKQQDIYMESMEAHLNLLRAEGEELYQTLFNAEDLNPFIDALTSVVNGIENIIESLGGGKGLIAILGSVGLNVFGDKITSGISRTVRNIQGYKENIENATQEAAIIEEYELSTDRTDARTAHILSLKKELLKVSDSLTKEEVEAANTFIKQTNELYKQQDAFEENKKLLEQMTKLATGEKLQVDQNTGSISSDKKKNLLSKLEEKRSSLANEKKWVQENYVDSFNQASILDTQRKGQQKLSKFYATKAQKFWDENNLEMRRANLATGRGSELYTEQSIALLQQYETLLTKSKEANQRALNSEEQLKEILFERKEAYEELQGSIENFGLEVKDLPKDAQQEFKKLQKVLESTFSSVQAEELLEPGQYKQASEALSQYIELLKQLGVDTKKAEEVLKTFNEENVKISGALDDNKTAADKLKSSFDLTKAIGSVVDFTGALANAVSGVQTLTNLPSIWNNDDLTTGEKFVQTLTNMSFGLGMVASSIGPVISGLSAFFGIQTAATAAEIANTASTAASILVKDRKTKITSEEILATLALNKTLDDAAKKRVADAVAAKFEGEAIEDVTEDKLKEALTEEMKQQNPSGAKKLFNGGKNLLGKLGNSKFGQATGGKIVGALGKGGAAATTGGTAAAGTGIAAGIATVIGVAAVIAAIATVTYVAIKAYNKKTDALKSAIKEEERLKEVAAEVRREYEEINSLIDEYGSLTEKIDELTEGTHEWREAIMQANEKALELIQTYDNLQWSYNNDGLIEIDPDSLKQVQNAALMKSVAAQNASINATQRRRDAQFDVDLQKIYRDINDNSYLIEKEDDIEDIFKEWQNSANKEQLRNDLVEREVDETADEGIVIRDAQREKATQTIDDLILSFEELNKSVEKNNKLVQIENQQKYQNMLMAQGQDNAAAISGIISTKTSDTYEEDVEEEKKKVKKQRESIDNQEWIIQWGASQGLDLDKGTIKQSGGDTFKYQDTNGNWHAVEYDDAYDQLARANIDASNMSLENIVEARQVLSTTLNGLSNDFADAVSSIFVGNKTLDTSALEDYTWDQIKALETNINALGDTIEQETKTALENSVKVLRKGLENINAEQGWTEGIDDKVASVLEEGAIYNSSIWENYSKKTITIIGNALNQVGVVMGDGGEKIADFLSGMGDAAADFIGGIDWNSENLVEDFATQCLKLGREIDYTDDNTRELLASLSAMNGELMGSKEAFGKISTIISGLNGYGDSISQEDYTKLYSQYGELIDEYFTQMKDGTYALTDAANDFRAELEALEKMKIQKQLNDLIDSFGSSDDKDSLIKKINSLKVGYEKVNEANVESQMPTYNSGSFAYTGISGSMQSVTLRELQSDDWGENMSQRALMLYLEALSASAIKEGKDREGGIWDLDNLDKFSSDYTGFATQDWNELWHREDEDYIFLDDEGLNEFRVSKDDIEKTITEYYRTLLEEQNIDQYHDLNSLNSIISEASSLNIIDTTKANELYNFAKEEENRKIGATGSSAAVDLIREAITKFDPDAQNRDDIIKLANQMLQFSTSEEDFEAQVAALRKDLKIDAGDAALLDKATWDSLVSSAKKSFEVSEITKFLDNLELSIKPTLDTSQAIKDFEDLKRQLMGDKNFAELSTSLSIDFERNQLNALEYKSNIDSLNARYAAGEFVGNEQAYYDELKKYTDLLKSTTLENQQIFQQLQEMEIQGYEQIAKYHEEIISLTEQQIELNDLLGESSSELNKQLRDSAVKIFDDAQARLLNAKQDMEYYSSAPTSAEYQAAVEEYRAAAAEYQDAAISAIQAVDDEYIASIDNIFKKFEEGIAGNRGLKAIKDEWDWTQSLGDKYLDSINAEYGKRSVARAFDEALAINTSVKAQQALNRVKEEELSILNDKVKLTQYDLDRANQMLEITKAQIALEEAQQDQSQMRLVRGADGTYGYEYVADQNKILEAEQNLEAVQNNLYNLDTEEYQRSLDEMYESYVTYYEKMKELASDEEGLTKDDLQLLEEMENELIATAKYSKDIETNIGKSLSEIIGTTITSENVKAYVSAAGTGMAEFASEILANGLSIAEGSIPVLVAGKQTEWANARKVVTDQVSEMKDDINKILLGEQGEDGTRSGGIYATLLKDATDYVTNFDTQVRDKIIESWKEMKEAALDYQKAVQLNGRDAIARSLIQEGASSNIFDENYNIKDKAEAEIFLDDYMLDWTNQSEVDQARNFAQMLDKIAGGSEYSDYVNNWYNAEKEKDNLKYYQNHYIPISLLPFDTGGYTGEWGSDGRLAMLHEKELVLNKDDTANILTAVDSVRAIQSALNNSLFLALLEKFNVQSHNFAKDEISKEMQVEQQVKIEAIFPGVSVAAEVEEALNNIINDVAQELTKNTRG